MEFEWDGAKSDACLAGRGFDFAHAAAVFADPDRLVEHDDRRDYGEPRFRVIGRIDGQVFVVVYTPRFGRIRLISARRANRQEVKRYGARADDSDG